VVMKLRLIHIQMDDIQLYQIFWSFMVVYIVALACYFLFLLVSVYYHTYSCIKVAFRLLMFTVIYQIVEIILKR
jgi:hypothetical protein